jgi:hypothetical protein
LDVKLNSSPIILKVALAVLFWLGPVAAGYAMTFRAVTAPIVKLSLGLRIDSDSISFDGIFILDNDSLLAVNGCSTAGNLEFQYYDRKAEPNKVLDCSTTRVRPLNIHSILIYACKGYAAIRAVHHTVYLVVEHWLSSMFWNSSHTEGPFDADCR